MNISSLKDKPFDLGYKLSSLKNEGMNFKEISEKTNIDRNQVRGYIRINDWSDEVKNFVHENNISVSQLIKAALKAGIYDNEDKLIEYLSDSLKDNQKLSDGENREVVSNVSTINRDFIESKEIEVLKKIISSQTEEIKILKNEILLKPNIKVFDLLNVLKYIILAFIGAGLTLYLVYQNYDFFSATEKGVFYNLNLPFSLPSFSVSLVSLANSIVAEVILLLSAFFMYTSKEQLSKWIARFILLGTIIGIGVFMHSSIENKIYSTSDTVKNLNQEKAIILSSITSNEKTRDSYSLEYKSKRQELSDKISIQTNKLSQINTKLASEKSVVSGNESRTIWYNTGLRVAAMILNVMLLHLLLFKRESV